MGNDVEGSYDRVAATYAARLSDELDHKPLDRALLGLLAELTAGGTLADVGCGPGHVTRFLAARHEDVVGLDLSAGMIAQARAAAPELTFQQASMLDLPVSAAAWRGIAAFYSIIHFDAGQRARAIAEFARVLAPGGWLLLAFHTEAPDRPVGSVAHIDTMLDEPVDLDGHFPDPDVVSAELASAGFTVAATTLRAPVDGHEYPSRRAYLLARR